MGGVLGPCRPFTAGVVALNQCITLCRQEHLALDADQRRQSDRGEVESRGETKTPLVALWDEQPCLYRCLESLLMRTLASLRLIRHLSNQQADNQLETASGIL
jgi:hypothetical protein